MSEHFLKLDPNNYDTEFDYLLNNGIFSFDEFKSLYQEGKITNEDFNNGNYCKWLDYEGEENEN